MPPGIWNVEWPNVNAGRKYPLALDATLKDATGTFSLPNELVVDFVLPVHISTVPTTDPTLFHISQLGVFSAGVVISFAYDGETFATVNVPTDGFVPYSTFPVIGTGAFFDSRGWVTVGQIGDTLNSPGAWTFDADGTRFLPVTIRPDIRAVTSLSVIDSGGVSTPISGDIAFFAGSNFKFTVELAEDFPLELPLRTKDRIIFSAISGIGLQEDCDCNELDESAPCIQTINGIGPSASGNIAISGSACMDVTQSGSTVTISDTCSEPCCDCRELAVVTDAVALLSQQIADLDFLAQKLNSDISATRINLLASKTTGLPII